MYGRPRIAAAVSAQVSVGPHPLLAWGGQKRAKRTDGSNGQLSSGIYGQSRWKKKDLVATQSRAGKIGFIK